MTVRTLWLWAWSIRLFIIRGINGLLNHQTFDWTTKDRDFSNYSKWISLICPIDFGSLALHSRVTYTAKDLDRKEHLN